MCKRQCCPPQGGSGPGAIIAVIAGLIIAASILPLLIELLRLLALIALTVTAAAVLGLIVWAVIAWRRGTGRNLAIGPARHTPDLPPARVLIIQDHPASTRPGRYLTGTDEHLARQLAAALADPGNNPPGAGDLILLRRRPGT